MFPMKKGIARFFLACLVLLMVFPAQLARAEVARVSRLRATYEILPSGDVRVMEAYDYVFDGSNRGIYRDVDIRRGARQINPVSAQHPVELKDASVVVYRGDSSQAYEYTDQTYGDEGQYRLYESESELIRFQVFMPSSNETRRVEFHYTLTNLVEKYNDVATFTWFTLPKGNDLPIEDIQIKLTIPAGAQKSDIKIFNAGDLTGYDEILDDRNVMVHLARAEARESIETQLVFPTGLVPESKIVYNRDELPNIMKRAAADAEEANRRRDEAKAEVERYQKQQEAEAKRREFGQKMSPLAWVLGGLGLGSLFLGHQRFGRQRKSTFVGDYYRELPGDYTPAVMSYLLNNRSISHKDIMATIMDLARKRAIELVPEERERRGFFSSDTETDYRMVARAEAASVRPNLASHERYLFDWFLEDLGANGSLSFAELETLLKRERNAYQFQGDYKQFQSLVEDNAHAQEFWEENDTTGSGPYMLAALAVAGLGALFLLIFSNPLGLFPLIAGILAVIYLFFLRFKPMLSQYGSDQTSMWQAFKRFLLDFSNMDQAEVPSIAIWDHYLVYATSLGVAKEVIEQLPKVYTPDQLNDPTFRRTYHPDFYYGRGYYAMDRSLNNALNQATSTIRKAEAVAASRRSSSSGSGGGFSGGSFGGGGSRGGTGGF